MIHRDEEVQQAIVKLLDALCTWERNTGIESVLILREKDGYALRATSGKPLYEDNIPDAILLENLKQS